MSERGTGVLEQYGLEVFRTWRTRGAFLCETSEGLKLLKEWNGSDRRIQFEYEMLSGLSEVGLQVDCCMLNEEGRLISVDEDQTRYVLRDWYEGRECNTRETGEVLTAAKLLAKLHAAFRRLDEEHILERKEEEFLRDQREREAQRELVGMEIGVGEREQPESSIVDLETAEGTFCQSQPEALPGMLERHNRELKRTRSFVKARKKKTDFELVVIGGFEKFYRQAEEAADLSVALPALPENGWCHGEYSHHHVLLGDHVCAVTGFSRVRRYVQVSDLYYFMRKILEKHRWNLKLSRRLLDTYTAVLPLTGEEWKYLYILFLYPEKYWKQMNYYVNSNKAWIPARNVDKLRVLENQFEARTLFLEELKRKAGF
ncbi:MAG: spore coat protein CotS [Lachnospiraceae bacterium]|nr:spore coat protein CotS [Lachnospiraceae bacterium]